VPEAGGEPSEPVGVLPAAPDTGEICADLDSGGPAKRPLTTDGDETSSEPEPSGMLTEQNGVLAAVLVVGEPAVSSEPESGGEPAELNGVKAAELGNGVLAAELGIGEPAEVGGELFVTLGLPPDDFAQRSREKYIHRDAREAEKEDNLVVEDIGAELPCAETVSFQLSISQRTIHVQANGVFPDSGDIVLHGIDRERENIVTQSVGRGRVAAPWRMRSLRTKDRNRCSQLLAFTVQVTGGVIEIAAELRAVSLSCSS